MEKEREKRVDYRMADTERLIEHLNKNIVIFYDQIVQHEHQLSLLNDNLLNEREQLKNLLDEKNKILSDVNSKNVLLERKNKTILDLETVWNLPI